MDKDYTWPLAFIALLLMAILFKMPDAQADECRNYTHEQQEVLTLAHTLGSEHGLGLTLAAIVQQESFVGSYVVRINPNDNSTHFDEEGRKEVIRGSYGITHILLSTAMWLENEDNLWKAKAHIAQDLITDDHYAVTMAIRKLKSVQYKGQTWRELVAKYNGAGRAAREYADKVAIHVDNFNQCGTFKSLAISKDN